MTSPGFSQEKLLGWALFLLLLPGAESLPCSHLAVESATVALGGNVTASCTIWRDRCPITKYKDIQVVWKWGNQQLRGSQYSVSHGVEVSNITVGPIREPITSLSCCLKKHGIPQVVNLTQIRAGHPPPQPQNLSCLLNMTSRNLECRWDPIQDSLLPTSITLKGFRSSRACQPLDAIPDCLPKPGQHACTIQRLNLQLYQKMLFWVSVHNALGTSTSEPLCADPMDLAWLEPPSLRDVRSLTGETDCVLVTWEAAKDGGHMAQACELRYQREGSPAWSLAHNLTGPPWQTRQCGFLFGQPYQAQMRCRRLPFGHWSEWSPPKLFTTHEKVPSGKLDTWWKSQETSKGREVQLLWKPMKPSEANGRILGYWVALSGSQVSGDPFPLCNTTERQCTFLVPPGTQRIYLTAYNSRGASQPTEISLLESKGQPVLKIQTSPRGEKSLCVWWEPPQAPPTGYVIEWHRVTSAADGRMIEWEKLQNGSFTQALIQENIKPFQRYNVSVYTLYGDRVGGARSVEAYTRQKAPSGSPRLHPGNIGVSTVEVWWEPFPIEERNGFITSYTIFWTDHAEDTNNAVVNASTDSFTISGLWSSRMYSLHIMASTMAGSTNGTSLVITTKAMDDLDITIVYFLIGLLLAMIFSMVVCFQKRKRMKTQLWPSVPDPANSSLGKWAPAILQETSLHFPVQPFQNQLALAIFTGLRGPPAGFQAQETLQAPKAWELSPAIVSAVLVIDADDKKCLSCGKSEPGQALEKNPTAFANSPSRNAEGPLPAGGSAPASYVNSPEPVQYAKVLAGSYRSQQEASPAFYIRSSSRQPLLGSLTPSPKPYENLWFHGDQPKRESSCGFRDDVVFLDGALLDFPLLQGLQINGDEDLGNLRRV